MDVALSPAAAARIKDVANRRTAALELVAKTFNKAKTPADRSWQFQLGPVFIEAVTEEDGRGVGAADDTRQR